MSSTLGQINNANDLVTRLASIGTVVIYLLVGLALVYIIYAIVQYFIKGNTGDENRHAATVQIVWGIVGLAIILSLWGIVNILINTFWTDTYRPDLPNANFVSNNGSSGAYGPGDSSGGSNGASAQYNAQFNLIHIGN